MKLRNFLAIAVLATALPLSAAKADVNLVFSQSSTSVFNGHNFDVTLSLQATNGEQITSINYFLQELSAAGFYIISRNTAGSAINDIYNSDANVATRPGADLNPTNDLDLGGATADEDVPTGSGFIATFTISSGTAAPGQYTLNTFSNPGSGWSGPSPDFTESEFNQQASMTVTVVPEPATWSFLVLGGLAAIGVNRLRASRRS